MSIRVATQDDVPAMVDLGRQMHAESSYAPLQYDPAKVGRILSDLVAGAGVVFIAERDGQMIGGFAGALSEFWFGPDRVGVDYALFVHPDARGGTHAFRLLFAFEGWCLRKGAKEVRLAITTGAKVERTSLFYQRCGYVSAGPVFRKEL